MPAKMAQEEQDLEHLTNEEAEQAGDLNEAQNLEHLQEDVHNAAVAELQEIGLNADDAAAYVANLGVQWTMNRVAEVHQAAEQLGLNLQTVRQRVHDHGFASTLHQLLQEVQAQQQAEPVVQGPDVDLALDQLQELGLTAEAANQYLEFFGAEAAQNNVTEARALAEQLGIQEQFLHHQVANHGLTIVLLWLRARLQQQQQQQQQEDEQAAMEIAAAEEQQAAPAPPKRKGPGLLQTREQKSELLPGDNQSSAMRIYTVGKMFHDNSFVEKLQIQLDAYIKKEEGKKKSKEWQLQTFGHYTIGIGSAAKLLEICKPMWDEMSTILNAGPRSLILRKPMRLQTLLREEEEARADEIALLQSRLELEEAKAKGLAQLLLKQGNAKANDLAQLQTKPLLLLEQQEKAKLEQLLLKQEKAKFKLLATSFDGFMIYLPAMDFDFSENAMMSKSRGRPYEYLWMDAQYLLNKYYPEPAITTYEHAMVNLRDAGSYSIGPGRVPVRWEDTVEYYQERNDEYWTDLYELCRFTELLNEQLGSQKAMNQLRELMSRNKALAFDREEAFVAKWKRYGEFVKDVMRHREQFMEFKDVELGVQTITELADAFNQPELLVFADVLQRKPLDIAKDSRLARLVAEQHIAPVLVSMASCALVLRYLHKGWRERLWIVVDPAFASDFENEDLNPWLYSATDRNAYAEKKKDQEMEMLPWVIPALYNSHREMQTRRMLAAFQKEAKRAMTDKVQKNEEEPPEKKRVPPHRKKTVPAVTADPRRRMQPMTQEEQDLLARTQRGEALPSRFFEWMDRKESGGQTGQLLLMPPPEDEEALIQRQQRRKVLPSVFVPMIMSFVQGRVKVH